MNENSMQVCPFCASYDFLKEAKHESGIKIVLRCALVEHVKFGGKLRGRTTNYFRNGEGFALNYCPVCGKELKA